MIGRKSSRKVEEDVSEFRNFDAFELRLGDLMRGERATLGKSLLDVQRELRIKAAYISAIENCDPDAFDTPGFIAGYVRSYARYLGMNPDDCFAAFCAESGFQVAHGMSAEASGGRKVAQEERRSAIQGRDAFGMSSTPFAPVGESFLSRIEPGAIGSMLVLVGLIGAIGYGGYSVLQEVQRVQLEPVDQAPTVLTDLDPLAGTGAGQTQLQAPDREEMEARTDALDRLYRAPALDVPVLVARDAPIATLDPSQSGAFANITPEIDTPSFATDTAVAEALQAQPLVPQVVEDLGPTIRMVAAYPSWVRVRSVEGNTLFEGTMEPGDTWDIPATEAPPTLRTGESGAIYFAMGTDCYGPVGERGAVTSGLALETASLAQSLDVVVPEDGNSALNRMFADLRQVAPARLAKLPCQSN